MATITVRNIPEELVSLIKQRASRHHCSMEQEVRNILANVVQDREESRKRIESLWREKKRPMSAQEVEEWLSGARRKPGDER